MYSKELVTYKKRRIVSIVGSSGAENNTLTNFRHHDKPILYCTDIQKTTSLFINGQDIWPWMTKFYLLSEFKWDSFSVSPVTSWIYCTWFAFQLCANKPKEETEQEAKKLLDYLGLSHRINHKPNELSVGEQQRVAVARALNKPAVIFADEPSRTLPHQQRIYISFL
jgi:lipoprotein-releasing system ATP-binding protein